MRTPPYPIAPTYKTLTAAQDAASIGGTIEYNTKRATSLDKTLFKAKFDTAYNDQSKNSDNPKIAFWLFLAGPMTVIPLFLFLKGVDLAG